MSLDAAVARVQDLALGMTSVSIKSAPDYPIESVDPLPMSVAYVKGGDFFKSPAGVFNFPVIAVEFHFSRANLKQAYQQICDVAYEFPQRLGGDPTLDSNVESIVATDGSRVAYTVGLYDWGAVTTQMIRFEIPVKILEATLTTA